MTVIARKGRNRIPLIGLLRFFMLALLDYESLPVSVEPGDPAAPEVARAVAQAIRAAEPRLRVEHIGSTAVPGLAGKGVVDLVVLYREVGLARTREVLDALGFRRQAGRDPFPESRPMRVACLDWNGRRHRLHAHVVSAASDEAADMIFFRERLRTDRGLRAEYEILKHDLVRRGITDGVDYANAKGAFVRKALLL